MPDLVAPSAGVPRDGSEGGSTEVAVAAATVELYNELKGSESVAGLATLQAILDGTYAPLADAALTGTPTVPTASPGTDTTQVANTAFVKGAVDNATSGVIAYAVDSAGSVSDAVSSTTTLTAIRTSSMQVTFTVPPSGVVLVELEANWYTANGQQLLWGLLDGGVQVGNLRTVGISDAAMKRGMATIPVTGLTPGAVKTYQFAHRALTAAASATTRTGSSGSDNGIYRAVMKVIAA